jgi:hypothetical protein
MRNNAKYERKMQIPKGKVLKVTKVKRNLKRINVKRLIKMDEDIVS